MKFATHLPKLLQISGSLDKYIPLSPVCRLLDAAFEYDHLNSVTLVTTLEILLLINKYQMQPVPESCFDV
jgi:hypothetical protein